MAQQCQWDWADDEAVVEAVRVDRSLQRMADGDMAQEQWLEERVQGFVYC